MRPMAIVHQCIVRTVGVLLLLCYGCATATAIAAQAPVTDLRVLIDVSGSMKQNDPQNLRRPALKMLVGLIPDGTRSGVWTFGRYVNMQVKLGTVDRQWKSKANIEADRIHSRGLYTNIEEALKRSTYDWNKPDENYARHLILLTDGVVDVSKDPAVNQQSRQRILDRYLPYLKNAGVTVHTIALSDNTDHQLLKRMAVMTDGWYQQIDNADVLQRVFLKLFEKAAPADTLPLDENRFLVDGSVQDMTLLVFRNADSQATRVLGPENAVYTQQQKVAGVDWLSEQGFDLITFKNPAPGKWKIDAAIDPDNRVMVVTNLKLSLPRLPNNLLAGEALAIQSALQEDGKTITRPDFLKLVEFKIGQHVPDGTHTLTILEDNGFAPDSQAGDGVYSQYVDNLSVAGVHELSIVVDGKTFQRKKTHTIEVLGSPVKIEQQETAEGVLVTAAAVKEIVQLKTLTAFYQADGLGNGEMALDNDVLQHQFPLELAQQPVQLMIKGKLINGKPFVSRQTLTLIGTPPVTPAAVPEKIVEEKVYVEAPVPLVAEAETETDKVAPEPVVNPEQNTAPVEESSEEGVNWLVLIAWLVGGNAIVIGFGYFVYRKWFTKDVALNKSIDELDVESSDDDETDGEVALDTLELDGELNPDENAPQEEGDAQYREEIQGQSDVDSEELQSVADLEEDDAETVADVAQAEADSESTAEIDTEAQVQEKTDENEIQTLADEDLDTNDETAEPDEAIPELVSEVESDENVTSSSKSEENSLESEEGMSESAEAESPATGSDEVEEASSNDISEDEIQALIDEADDVLGSETPDEQRKTEA